MFFLLLFSAGCGLLAAEQEVEKVRERATSTQVTDPLPLESKPAAAAASAKFESHDEVVKPSKLEIESLSQDEIRRIQAKLKASGFDPGPIDGILGPKTKSALLQLQSACSVFLGVTESSKVEDSGLKPLTGLTVLLSEPTRQTFSKEEIQQFQMRLKQSRFDPGPLDGIFGPKTKAAMLRARSGCSLAKQFPVIGAAMSVTGKRSPPTLVLTRETLTAASESPRPSDAFDRGGNEPSLVADKSTGADEIRLIQVHLKEAGFDPGPIDGILGLRTRSALQR
jgi:peptidoglycan hydrolase-like protein with peptidoglycan-binding domain